MVKAISFSPVKTAPLRAVMENTSPVKLKKFEFNEQFRNIVITNNTSLINHQYGGLGLP